MNNLELEILNLYDSIILVDEPEISIVKESKKNENNEKKLTFEGGLGRNLFFMYHLPNKWEDEDERMIKNLITNALKFQLSDVALFNLQENENPVFQRIIDELQPAQIIFWGCEDYVNTNNLNNTLYEVQLHNNLRYINVDAANAFHNNKELKMQLWNSIQTLLK